MNVGRNVGRSCLLPIVVVYTNKNNAKPASRCQQIYNEPEAEKENKVLDIDHYRHPGIWPSLMDQTNCQIMNFAYCDRDRAGMACSGSIPPQKVSLKFYQISARC